MAQAPLPPRRPPPAFQPRFLMGMIYLVGFFFLYAMIGVLPDLLAAVGTLGSGPDELTPAEIERAESVARDAANRTVLVVAFVGALLTTVVGSYYRVLPGLREG